MAPEIKIRQATQADAFELRRLAALDDTRALRGDALLVEEAGEIRAAIGIEDGRVIANPFARTADLVEMLRAELHHITAIAA